MRWVSTIAIVASILFSLAMESGGRELLMVRPTGRKNPVADLLLEDIRTLEHDLGRMEEYIGSPAGSMSTPSPRSDATLDRLDRIEELVESLEGKGGRPVLLTSKELARLHLHGTEPRPRDLLFSIDLLQSRIQDEHLAPAERIATLEALNHLPVFDARTDEVVRSMLDLLPRLRDNDLRRDLINHLRHVQDPEYRSMLLEYAFFETDRHVRGAAVRQLRAFADEQDVRQALSWIRVHDPDHGVRANAKRALGVE